MAAILAAAVCLGVHELASYHLACVVRQGQGEEEREVGSAGEKEEEERRRRNGRTTGIPGVS